MSKELSTSCVLRVPLLQKSHSSTQSLSQKVMFNSLVWMFVDVFVSVCSHKYGRQKTILGVLLWELSTWFFETRSLTGTRGLTDEARLAG